MRVIAIGMGVDSDGALKSALRNAVSQAVGTMIDSATMVANDEIIDDKILSHSGGFVEKYELIGEPKAQDGLVSVKIEAEVRKMNLRKEMEVNDIFLVKKIDGKVFTKQIQLDDAAAMFKSKLEGFPLNCLDIKLNGEPYYDDKNGKFVVEISYTLDTAKVNAVIKDLITLLDAASPEPAAIVKTSISDYYDSLQEIDFKFDEKNAKHQLFLPVFINEKRTLGTWKRFPITENLMPVCNAVFFNPPSLLLELTIEGDIPIVENTYKLPLPFSTVHGSGVGGSQWNIALAPYLNFNYGKGTVTIKSFKPAPPKNTQVYRFDLSADEVKMIKDVKIGVR